MSGGVGGREGAGQTGRRQASRRALRRLGPARLADASRSGPAVRWPVSGTLSPLKEEENRKC